ncbi:MAG: prepilin-type N-terminal cleavage/methylation domain-containing protein [Planctomycetaceae bacterium]|jgi:prepilin-type N-terminal cleavage/methylation domain-containing protein|nr:prepilin-type N-terminal cleavage/methylation domain-containing protein [Planctomycetaceae bacterium]
MRKAFTLIELLIVIGILAALAAAALPMLSVNREEALSGINQYNKGAILKTLKEYQTLTGKLPEGLHTGLQDDGTTTTLMPGITGQVLKNFTASGANGSRTLSTIEATALRSLGLGHVATGEGDKEGEDYHEVLGYAHPNENLPFLVVNEQWQTGSGAPLTFNGHNVESLEKEGYTKVIALYVTPTVNWEVSDATGNNAAWTKSVKEFGLDFAGKNPLVADDTFAYYIVYIGVGETVYAATTTLTNVHLHSMATLADAKDEAEEHITDVTAYEDAEFAWVDAPDGSGSEGTVTDPNNNDAFLGTVTIMLQPAGTAKLLGITDSNCEPLNP